MRWSLKTAFLITTLIALFLASQYNERNREVLAAKQIQNLGGEVSYQWQQPSVIWKLERFCDPRPRLERYEVTLPDGTTETRIRSHSYTVWISPTVQTISHGSTTPPTQNFFNAIWPDNSDVIVEAVRINEADVDENILVPLRDLKSLKTLQLCRSTNYFIALQGWPPLDAPDDWRTKQLKKHGEPFESAKALVQAELPDLNIIDGLVPR